MIKPIAFVILLLIAEIFMILAILIGLLFVIFKGLLWDFKFEIDLTDTDDLEETIITVPELLDPAFVNAITGTYNAVRDKFYPKKDE